MGWVMMVMSLVLEGLGVAWQCVCSGEQEDIDFLVLEGPFGALVLLGSVYSCLVLTLIDFFLCSDEIRPMFKCKMHFWSFTFAYTAGFTDSLTMLRTLHVL